MTTEPLQAQSVLLGCARQPGSRLFAESGLGRGAPGVSGGGTPGFGISRSFFKITPDLRIHFVGYRGQIVPSAPPADPYRNGCDPSLATLPAVGTLDPWANSPQLAVTGLIAAAAAGDQARASAFLAGADGQHLRLNLSTGLGPNWVVTGLAAG